MSFCSSCGTQFEDGKKFCPNCGVPAPAASPAPAPAAPSEAFSGSVSPAAEGPSADAQNNKLMGVLAYIIFLVPLLAAPKDSKFARFHTNQGMVLCIAAVAWNILSFVLTFILAMFDSFITGILSLLIGFLGFAVSIAIGVFAILGIVNALNGKMKPLPLIGKIKILK